MMRAIYTWTGRASSGSSTVRAGNVIVADQINSVGRTYSLANGPLVSTMKTKLIVHFRSSFVKSEGDCDAHNFLGCRRGVRRMFEHGATAYRTSILPRCRPT